MKLSQLLTSSKQFNSDNERRLEQHAW